MLSTDTLGCVTGYIAYFISKEGIPLGEIPVTKVEWNRVLDDISEATVEVAIVGSDCAPCDIIKELGVWHHEMYLFRDGEFVWSGPVVQINVSRSKATIVARDLFQLMDERLVHSDLCFAVACTGAATELVDIGAALIDDAFILDGHNYLIEKFNTTGLLGERLYTPGEHSWAVMQEVLRLGLDATVLGRKIILGAAPFGQTNTLTDDDFLVDLEYEIDGLGLATFAITKGTGVVGTANWDGTTIRSVQPYYGLLEFEGNDRQELNTQALADQGAAAVLTSHYPAPATLITPTGAGLSPNAPVTIAELVPGVLIPVVAAALCREVYVQYVLIELVVTWDEESGEQVQVTLGTVASTNSGEDSTGN